jgi:hypothetical protein
VLERNLEAMNPVPLPGRVWLDAPGKVLHADERFLEFTEDPPAGLSPTGRRVLMFRVYRRRMRKVD